MKKTVKRVLWVIGIVLIVILFGAGGFILKLKLELKKMNVVETGLVTPGVYAIKDSFVNMYLLKDSDNYVAVDAGNKIETIQEELKKLQISPEKIIAVLLTHTDGDHVGALKLFTNAKVYLSSDEEQMINGTTSRMMGTHNKIDVKSYNLINDQDTLIIGNLKIKGILTPGHTPGSMCYLINGKYLFVGDAFGLKNGKIDKPNSIFTEDMATAVKSLTKIAGLPEVKYIFTGHTGYSDNYSKAMNNWKEMK